MPVDYHIHTALCGHAADEMEEYVEQALRLGLTEMGFADHLPMEVWGQADPCLTMSLADMEIYRRRVADLQARYQGRIRIRFGLEADYVPGKERVIEDFLRRYDFDYVIGSVHFLGADEVDFSRDHAPWTTHPVDEIFTGYFATLRDCAACGLFDFLGHPDLVKKFGHRPSFALDDWYDRIATVCAAHGIAAEINTSGLHRPVGEPYPHEDFVRAFVRHGVPMPINSDAHLPQEVGRDRAAAEALARRAGLRRTPLYEKRRLVGWDELPVGE
ncbi:MAG: histidinol-phosphatase [Myxococcales bacterium]|nr:histidinol-phosphatase [Myxococcales bacterium]